ncbi:LOW QUALITY PROTEIN: RAF-like serine/threonine-protein kinase PRAF [Elaeis guineensis]|uniref:LOW QUALITY PROTEIN: RAF-like serine/threonine-protein kinase PRAF n=1 Tax=Elaeis guineensis var. tenera TaxID=51953 RepID=UPI003C6D21B0
MASADEESLSPKNRLKLLCSYGGKILPRPSDGQLKYVGGETRVLAVPRSISFSELKKRIREMFNNAKVVIKYQIMPEDLDALVSVTCDEDLRHMLDEYDRHEPRSPSNSPRFRLFLFSAASPPLASLSDAAATCPIEQRYVEAINGMPPAASTLSLFNISSSAATSPTSTIDLRDAFRPTRSNLLSTAPAAGGGGGKGLHRVRSTPNLGTANLSQMSNGVAPQPYGGHQQDRHHHHHHTTMASRSQRRRTETAEGCGGWGVGPCGTRCVDADVGAG